MSTQMKITPKLLHMLAALAASRIAAGVKTNQRALRAYGVPRGGVCAALAVASHMPLEMVDTPEMADLFIDDLIDSGSTRDQYRAKFPKTPFYVLIDKSTDPQYAGKWIVFPWEHTEESSVEDNVRRILQFVEGSAEREGLLETPARVAKALKHWFGGYEKNATSILKVFKDGGEKYDQMITVKDIPIYSHCEHHMAPIFGTCTISYIPDGSIVGLSKLSRLADMYARRLQVQERLTDQIADALFENLKPKGVGVVIKARHMCMESRGICQQGHHTVTTALRGVIKDEEGTRAEFLRMSV